MSHLIPPLVSNSPPPMVTGGPDDLDDEFGDFAVPGDINFDGYSLPSSPMHLPNPFNIDSSPLSIPECPKDLQNGSLSPIDRISESTSCKNDDNSKTVEVPKVQKTVSECVNNSAINIISEYENAVTTTSENCETKNNDATLNQQDITSIHNSDNLNRLKSDESICNESKNSEESKNKLIDNQTDETISDYSTNKNELNITLNKNSNDDKEKQKDEICIVNDFGEFQNCFPAIEKDINIEKVEDTPTSEFGEFENYSVEEKKIVRTDRITSELKIDELTLDSDNYTIDEKETTKVEETISDFGDFENYDIKEKEVSKDNDKISDFGDFEYHSSAAKKDTDETSTFGNFENYSTEPENVIKSDNITSDVENSIYSSKDKEITKTDDISSDFGEFDNYNIKDKKIESYENKTERSETKTESDENKIESVEKTICDSSSQVPDSDIPDLNLKCQEFDDDDLDFGDFESSDHPISITKNDFTDLTKTEPIEFEANFSDFQPTEKDDDFGDFNDYSTQSTSVNLTYSKTELLEYSEKTIKNIFKMDDVNFPEFQQEEDFTVRNPVFNNLKIIENTQALNFQWNNSEGQKMLLKSLNIDSRNILYGPRWNPTMPKFASNLGFQPLEPQKTDLVPSTSSQNETQPVEVPDAKFDWTSSGLVNPLDCSQDDMLLDLEQLVTSLDLAPTTSSSFLTATTTLAPPPIPAVNSPVDDYQTWDHWLQCQTNKEENTEDKQNIFKLPITDILNLQSEANQSLPQSDNESVNSLKFTPTDTEIENQTEDDFTNFESYKTDEISWSPVNMQPLRETHISAEQPEVYPSKTEIKDDDEFTDFQMSLPEKLSKQTVFKPLETVLKPIQPSNLIGSSNLLKTEIKHPSNEQPFDQSHSTTKTETIKQPIEETSKASVKFNTILKPLEPLKPIVLQPTVLSTAPTRIEWPEPGIVDETRISELDINYSNKNVVEDDDWSDFVSVTKPKENIQSKSTENFGNFSLNRQLELSVPNLQNTQLNCKSLPQMQPAVASPIHKPNSIPSTQQIAVQQLQYGYQPPYQIPLQQPHVNPIGIEGTEFEPSLKPISTTSLDTFITSPKKLPPHPIQSGSVFQPMQSVEYTFLKMQQSTLPSSTDDDDDWSDFVSNQTVASDVSNGWNTTIQKPQLRTIAGNMKPYFSEWSQDVQPNIITNPVHFDVFQSYQPSNNKDMKLINKKQQMTNNVPTISSNAILPELDFASPKSKFFIKK